MTINKNIFAFALLLAASNVSAEDVIEKEVVVTAVAEESTKAVAAPVEITIQDAAKRLNKDASLVETDKVFYIDGKAYIVKTRTVETTPVATVKEETPEA